MRSILSKNNRLYTIMATSSSLHCTQGMVDVHKLMHVLIQDILGPFGRQPFGSDFQLDIQQLLWLSRTDCV